MVLCYVWACIVSAMYIVFCMGHVCNRIGDIYVHVFALTFMQVLVQPSGSASGLYSSFRA